MWNNSWGTFKTAVIGGSCVRANIGLSTIIHLYLLMSEKGSLNLEMVEHNLTHARWTIGFMDHPSSTFSQWKYCIYSSHPSRQCKMTLHETQQLHSVRQKVAESRFYHRNPFDRHTLLSGSAASLSAHRPPLQDFSFLVTFAIPLK